MGGVGEPAAQARERLDVRVFARVPNPGQPEPIAIGGPDGSLYVTDIEQALIWRVPSTASAPTLPAARLTRR